MNGYLLLEGGAEFGGSMSFPDLRAIELAGGVDAPIAIIPTAAAPDHNHVRAGSNGLHWFASLGARNVFVLPIIDRKSAENDNLIGELRTAKLIYLLGGFTHYLGQTLAGSKAWAAIFDAYNYGAVIAGSSAGAMVLCEYYFDPSTQSIQSGLNLISNSCIIPHHNTFGKNWSSRLRELLPDTQLLGIDEQTGMINDQADGNWTVYGKGQVTVYSQENSNTYAPGVVIEL